MGQFQVRLVQGQLQTVKIKRIVLYFVAYVTTLITNLNCTYWRELGSNYITKIGL